VKRIIFLGICFFLTFTAIQVALSQWNEQAAAKIHFFVAKNSSKDFNFVVNGILDWEDCVQETKSPSKHCGVLIHTQGINLFSTTYTTAHRTAIFIDCSLVLQRLFVLFENFRL
jgi:hypothetical protein